MRKLVLCILVCLTTFNTERTLAGETNFTDNNKGSALEHYISNLYLHIDFGHSQCLAYEVFNKAYHGYLNLRNSGKLSTNKDIITICDFSLSSTQNRFWVIDLRRKKVLYNTYVAHGHGSGEEYAMNFSNRASSHQSSLGFYVTGDTYDGEHGTSLHLLGMDNNFNDAAFDRGIVVHGADYVSDKHIACNNYLGRSWGCPAVPSHLSAGIINTIKEGTCLFIYYPQQKYLQSSYWLNKPIDHLPEDNMYPDFKLATNAGAIRDTVYEFISSNGRVDSVVTKKHSL